MFALLTGLALPVLAEDAAPATPPAAAPSIGQTVDILYKYLLAELAYQRGQGALSLELYQDILRRAPDPLLARRATDMALYQGQGELALQFARRWMALEPNSREAEQLMVALVLRQGRPAEIRRDIPPVLASAGDRLPSLMMYVATRLAESVPRDTALGLIKELTEPYKTLPEARWAQAHVALVAGDKAEALSAIGEALKLRPDWEAAAVLRAQIRVQTDPKLADEELQAFIRAHPKALDARLTRGRLLVSLKRYDDALAVFRDLRKDAPKNPDVAYAAGVLAWQAQKPDQASAALEDAIKLGYKDEDAVRIVLGDIAAKQNKSDVAIRWWNSVDGEQFGDAQLRIAKLYAQQGRLEDGRKQLRTAAEQQPALKPDFLRIEAGLLRDAKRYQDAYDLLTVAVSEFSDNAELFYDRALLAERLNHLDQTEQDLRQVLKLQPDHPQALNALGYTLADHSTRLDEALGLIEQALKLNPDDPATLDSMGWVQYKLGRLEESLGYLRRAYAADANAEIAAHLGEVLWQMGQKEEAKATWAKASKDDPQDEVLQTTVQRFQAK